MTGQQQFAFGVRGRRVTRTVVSALALASALGGAFTAQASADGIGLDEASVEIRADASGTPATQAGSHPFDHTTRLRFSTTINEAFGFPIPDHQVKDVVVELPPGFVGDPTAVPRCSEAKFEEGVMMGECPDDTQVGTAVVQRGGMVPDPMYVRIYNLHPGPGSPARFGGRLMGTGPAATIMLDATVRTGGDYGLTMTSKNIPTSLAVTGVDVTFWGVPGDSAHDGNRGECYQGFFGPSGELCPVSTERKPFLSMPAHCEAGPLTTRIAANSWDLPGAWARTSIDHDAGGQPLQVTGCENLRFAPKVSVRPDTTAPATPAGFAVDLEVPYPKGVNELATPPLRRAVVTMPEGVAISPGAADGLQGCSDAQIGVDTDADPQCPSASRIGTVSIDTPLLEDPLEGSVYLGTQTSNDPASGKMFRLFLVAQGSGVTLKLPGAIVPDPVTGQLTTTFDNTPQLPFTAMSLRFKGGSRAPLVTPSTCGTKTATAALTAWSGQVADQRSSFAIDCAASLGQFAPSFVAGSTTPVAGAYAPFTVKIGKPDGNSDLGLLAIKMPPGLLANLKGNVGSRVGTARVASGAGAHPFWLSGPVVLEGPYGDAPFSLRVSIPVVAGPFNLGTVVVRQRIYVDRNDAHVTIVSDPLPHIVSGVPVQLQRLEVAVDKPGFMVNPTSCEPTKITGTLAAVNGRTATIDSRFQVGDCASLDLEPKLGLELTGASQLKTGGHPGLDATLKMPGGPGQANLKQVEVALPLAVALDPKNARALCTPEQAAARRCPEASIVGTATAETPILDQPLSGPVYFVEGRRRTATGRTVPTLPKLFVTLRGQVELDLWADSDVKDRKLVSTFAAIPDAPISAFRLRIDGGKSGILKATGVGGRICDAQQRSEVTFVGQSGKQRESKLRMSSDCRLRVASKAVSGRRLKVKVSGLGRGRLTISGPGVRKTSRAIKSASVATIQPKLSKAGLRAAKARGVIKARVSFDPAGKAKAKRLAASVRPAKAKARR
ncbi:MAG: hypothetical protein ITG02_09675 [Patulibacter sp.]|nr:hypothetical protein [Patulibacter sp.]